MELSDWGLKFLKNREVLVLKAYRRFVDEPWTIGYGHTKDVQQGDVCTEFEAEQWLREDVGVAEDAVNRLVKVFISQREFDALVSLVFNVGVGAFSRSQALKDLNRYDRAGFADQAFDRERGFVRVNGKIIKGLVNRRAAERALFQNGEWSFA